MLLHAQIKYVFYISEGPTFQVDTVWGSDALWNSTQLPSESHAALYKVTVKREEAH